MKNVSQIAKAMQGILITKANEVGESSGLIKRERELTGSSFLCGLLFGWLANPQASLSDLSQSIGNAGTPLTRQGLAQRFDEAAVTFCRLMLEISLQVLIGTCKVPQGILSRFTYVILVDSSIITLPNHLHRIWRGSGGFGENASIASLKLNVRWDVKNGQLKVLELSDGTQHDRRSRAHTDPIEAGSLLIEDLGYFKIADLARVGEQDAYWLTRYKQGVSVYDLDGNRIKLDQLLPQQVGDRIDCWIRLGQRDQLLCRLVAERVPQAVVAQRQERIRETARQNQRPVSVTALLMAHWTIYLTNLPMTLCSPDDIFVLGRYRWQIELLFKLWKSDLQVDKWASQNPHRILCEIYIKLIGAIVSHWCLLVACWHNPRRSLRQAMPTIRGLAWQFANSMANRHLLNHALQAMCRSLLCCRMDKSRDHPRAFQIIYESIA